MAIPVESLKNTDSGKTWKEDFSSVDKNVKGYDELLAKFKQYVSEQEYLGKFQEKQLDSYLKSLDNLYDHWDEINAKVEDLRKEMDSVGLSASEIQNIFTDISNTISTAGQRLSAIKAPITQLAALAGNVNRAYEIQDGFTERAVRSDLRRIQTSRDLYDSIIKRYTGGSLEFDAIEKARKAERAKLDLSESEIAILEKKLQTVGSLNEAERSRLKDLKNINREAESAVEILSDKNIDAADRLVNLAKFNVANRKAVVRKTPAMQLASGVLGKFAGFLGLPDLQEEIKDIKESTLQKAGSARRDIYENRVEPIESRQSELNRQIEAKRKELEVLRSSGSNSIGIRQALNDVEAFRTARGTEKSYEARKLLRRVQLKQEIVNESEPGDELAAKEMDYLKTVQTFRDLTKLEVQAQKNASKLVEAQKELDTTTKGITGGSLKAMVKAFENAVSSGWMLAFVVGKALWNQFKAVDELGVKLQREIGTWEGGVAGANRELISSKDYLEQAYEISTKFHIDPARVFTPVELAKAAEFKNMSNLSAQEVANLAVRSKSVNQSVTAYNTSMKEGYNNILKNTTSAVAFGSVQKEIANTTDAISLSLGDNPKKIAEAATAALSLGMSMKEIEGVAENLMNFESSIEHEMEAQLLTGRQMNLAKAREYALNNDIAGLSRELHNNGVDAAKFQSMTYIQQKSLAQALGMSRDQLAGMVRQQILGMNVSDEQKRKMLKMNEEDYRRMTTEQQWQKAKEKFLQTLVPLMKPVLDIVTMLVGPLKWIAGMLGKFIGFIQPIIDAVQSFFSKMQKWTADGDSAVKKVVGTVVTGGTNMASSLLMFSLVLGTVKKSLGGIGTAFKTVKTIISTGFGTITSIFKGAVGGIKSIVTAIRGIETASKSAVVANKALGTSLDSVGSKGLERTLARSSRKHEPAVWNRYYRIKATKASGKARNFTENTLSRAGKVTDRASKSVIGGIESTAANLDTKASKKVSKINRGVTKFNSGSILKGAAAMVLVAGALYILAKAVQQFDGVKWETLGKAGAGLGGLVIAAVILSNLASKALVGALAIAAMGVALIPLAYSLRLLEGVNWRTFAIMAASIAAFFVEFALIGTVIAGTAGIGGVVIAIGIAAVAAMGAALIPLAVAMQKLEGVSWKTFGMMCASIAAFCAEVALLGPLALVGLPGLLILSFALKLLSSTIAKLGNSFKGSDIAVIGEGITSLRSTLEGLKGLDIDLSSIRKFKRGTKHIAKALKSFSGLGKVELPSASNLINLLKGLETVDLSKVKIPNKIIRKLFGIFVALSTISGKNLTSGIDTLTASLVKFVEVLGKIDTEKFNSLSGKKIRQIAVAGIVSERVSENYNKSVDNKAKADAAKTQQANEVKVEKTNLDTVLAKMEDIKRTIVASRPDWNWLNFGNEAAKNIPNWQSPV